MQDDDSIQATKWTFGGCEAATVGVAGIENIQYGSLNCRDGTENDPTANTGVDQGREEIQFDVW